MGFFFRHSPAAGHNTENGLPTYEFWYFKQTTRFQVSGHPGQGSLIILPGRLQNSSDSHAFIQIVDTRSAENRYLRFPLSEFTYRENPFSLSIGPNVFSLSGIHLQAPDDRFPLRFDLSFQSPRPFSSRPLITSMFGPLGPLIKAPWGHEIVSLTHEVAGQGELKRPVDFTGASGFIEKHWGRSMPSSWIWIQSQDFPLAKKGTAFYLRIARIPGSRGPYNGCIVVLRSGGKEYRFTSIAGGHLELLETEGSTLRLFFRSPQFKLEVLARRHGAGTLRLFHGGRMDKTVDENALSWVRVVLKNRFHRVDEPIFDYSTSSASLEAVGDLTELQSLSPKRPGS